MPYTRLACNHSLLREMKKEGRGGKRKERMEEEKLTAQVHSNLIFFFYHWTVKSVQTMQINVCSDNSEVIFLLFLPTLFSHTNWVGYVGRISEPK